MTTFEQVLAAINGSADPAGPVEQRFATEFRQADSDEPGLVLGDDGVTYLVAADGTRTPVGGGGYTPPTARGQFTGGGSNDPTIASGGVAYLGWSATNIPNDVLDLTDPFNPTVKATGIHVMRVSVLPYAMSVDGYFKVVAVMALNSDQAESDNDSRLATAAQPTPEGSSGLTWQVAQGDIIGVRVYNRDGSADQRFGIDVATVIRVT